MTEVVEPTPNGDGEQPVPRPEPTVPLQPLPTLWRVNVAEFMVEGAAHPDQQVVVQFQTPQGNVALFFDGRSACELGAALGRSGRTVMAWETVTKKTIWTPSEG